MTISAQKQQEIVERRMRVASMRLAGVRDQRRIADALGVSVPTISRDFKALDTEWRERAAADIAVEKAIDLDRLDRLIMALWDKATKEGRWLATDRVLNLMQHRAKLLGLEAPQKREHTGKDGKPIQHDHIVRDMSAFTDDEIDTLAAIAERAKSEALS